MSSNGGGDVIKGDGDVIKGGGDVIKGGEAVTSWSVLQNTSGSKKWSRTSTFPLLSLTNIRLGPVGYLFSSTEQISMKSPHRINVYQWM